MAGNTFGRIFTLTTFGESHGYCVGGVLDGVPSGIEIDFGMIDQELARRRGDDVFSTSRKEKDQVVWMSGFMNGKTLGTPIAFYVENQNTRPQDYNLLEHAFRPGHGDMVYSRKYGLRDHRGGGRASARETVSRVIAGAIAKQILSKYGITISSTLSEIPNREEALEKNDTVGGVISCKVEGVGVGLGCPVFEGLQSRLAQALMSIPSVRGFELGSGFSSARMKGSEYADQFNSDGTTQTNHSGGINAGISNGMPLEMRVALHPIVTIPGEMNLLTDEGEIVSMKVSGRHDVCHVPRTQPIVEAMIAITLLDDILIDKKF